MDTIYYIFGNILPWVGLYFSIGFILFLIDILPLVLVSIKRRKRFVGMSFLDQIWTDIEEDAFIVLIGLPGILLGLLALLIRFLKWVFSRKKEKEKFGSGGAY